MAAFILQKMSSPHSDKNGRKVKMKLFGKLCAATVASTMLLAAVPTATPVAHAKIKWGAAAGAILGGIINNSTGHSSSGSNGGLFGGLSNQKHARQNPTSEEKLFLLAVEKNDFETAQSMLDAGVDINGVYPSRIGIGRGFNYSNQDTAFAIALAQENREMLQFLLERGANIRGWYTYNGNFCSYIELYLHKYNGSADLSLLQYLLDWGANINEYSISLEGRKIYPLDHCTQGYDRDETCYTTEFLLEKGAYTENTEYESNRMTPFLTAVSLGQKRIMNILAKGGANINARDSKGRNASQIAIDNHNMQIYKEVQDIIARGQQPSIYQDKKGESQKKK
ncbi:MAG: hypothetical protein IJU00_03375 [Selenomonas sp.]|nr:hypothetical protein [Selenomonas sp.]